MLASLPIVCDINFYLAQGLGKTITGLALISKTRGNLPTPPAGPGGSPVKCTWVKDPAGKPAAFYTGT